MNYLLDTCVFSDFFKKVPSVIHHFEKVLPTNIHISVISVMEIEYGLQLNVEREKKIRPVWEALLEQIKVLDFSKVCAMTAATIRAHLKMSGQVIGPYDILIAATALTHELTMVTSNLNEFKRISSLSIEDWRA